MGMASRLADGGALISGRWLRRLRPAGVMCVLLAAAATLLLATARPWQRGAHPPSVRVFDGQTAAPGLTAAAASPATASRTPWPATAAAAVAAAGLNASLSVDRGPASAHAAGAAGPGQPVALRFPRKSLWAAGWNAREHVATFRGGPVVRWDASARAAFVAVHTRAQFPADCAAVRYTLCAWEKYGFTSAIRDAATCFLLAALANRTAVLTGCDASRVCPDRFFRPWGACTVDHVHANTAGPPTTNHAAMADPAVRTVQLNWRVWRLLLSAPGSLWIWDEIRDQTRGGLRFYAHDGDPGSNAIPEADAVARYGRDAVDAAKLAVLRTLYHNAMYVPNDKVEHEVDQALQRLQTAPPPAAPGLRAIVHVRRSDKHTDGGYYWLYLQKHAPGGFQSVLPLTELISRCASTRPITSFMLVSDSPDVKLRRNELAAAFTSATTLDVRDESLDLLDVFLAQNHLAATFSAFGHGRVPQHLYTELTMILLVEMLVAIRRGDVLIGSGSCGVSQFIAQGLANRFNVDPNSLALWEEDVPLVKCEQLYAVPGEDLHAFTTAMPTDCQICNTILANRYYGNNTIPPGNMPPAHQALRSLMRSTALHHQHGQFFCTLEHAALSPPCFTV